MPLYQRLSYGKGTRVALAHIAQSIDGRIATASGDSRWISGAQDLAHNHRLRALFDVVLVGAGTVAFDDPQLTTRLVPGPHPVRVVLDPTRRLGAEYRVFHDGAAPTLLLCLDTHKGAETHLGQAELLGVAPDAEGRLSPQAALDALHARGLSRVFVEGGGVTISRFLHAGCLDRLQITVAPLLIGSGRLSFDLPAIDRLDQALRPRAATYALGEDVLFDLVLRG